MPNVPRRRWAAPAARHAALLITVLATALYTVAVASAGSANARTATPSATKAAEAHYTAASCNSTEQHYLQRDFARCFAMVRTGLNHQITADPNDPPPTALGPADIQAAYNLPSTGAGQVVGIVDAFGDSHAEADLAQFRSFYGLPPCTTANGCFQKVDQTGGTNYPPDDPGWGLETSLDLDAVSAACPACHILLVQGDDNSLDALGTAVDTAVSLGAKFVSNSYGVPGEDSSETDYDHYYNHQGVAVTASTGDTGDVTNWPAANPNVVAVGGTTLNRDTGDPRGWNETAWSDGGSGCSPYEPHPDYQNGIDTQCANRAMSDISADADPNTGLAVYDTLGQGGWLQVGGTSLSSPLVASMYALAGTPVPGTYPVTYPYDDPGKASDLYDVTEGSNGGCGNVLCNAGPGWDGPTGLGTPNGVNALTTGPHGDIAGEVTDSATHDPISGATVTTDAGYSATTDDTGAYDMTVPVGSYTVTASSFGYRSKSTSGVTVTEGNTTTADFALRSVPSVTVSGVVSDGSGHRWPLYAKITIDGYPNGAIWTDPYTGRYSVSLPEHHRWTLHVTPTMPGYQPATVNVPVVDQDVTRDVKVHVDATTCSTPGYAYHYQGAVEQFTGWTDSTPQDGWSVVDNAGNGQVWEFDNPGSRTPPPGGDSDFAIIDSDHYGSGNSQDSSLVSPVIDLSSQSSPEIGFDTEYREIGGQTADVDLSTDGGTTWTNVWHQDTNSVAGHVDVPVPQAAGQSDVQVRFHFTASWGWWWSLDNVFIGTRSCRPVAGGLVAGVVRDHNTHHGLVGAKVTSASDPSVGSTTIATPDDPNLPDGFYEFFSPLTGAQQFTASDGKYTAVTATVNVTPNWVTVRNWSLPAGHPTVSPGSVSVTETLGQSKTATLTFGNDGTKPVEYQLGEQNGAFQPMGGASARGAALQTIRGTYSPKAAVLFDNSTHPGSAVPLRSTTPADPPWQDIANFPTPTMDNAVAYNDGKVYSVAGYDGTANVAAGYVYDPATQAWSAIADAPEALESPGGAFVGGTLYLIGGWNAAGDASSTVYAYDPSSDSWSQKADLPAALAAPGVAVLNGSLYVVGGCTTGNCAPTSKATYQYDPGSDSWSQVADYPAPVAFPACGGASGEIVCAGGINADTNADTAAAYAYDPGSDSWTQVADMPYDNWAMSYAGANNMLEVTGGVTNGTSTVTNQAAVYDPASDSWSALPNANNAQYRGAGSCGMYQIGGSTGGFAPTPFAEVLPGYDQCGGATNVPWISETPKHFTVNPGQTQTVTVTVDSSKVPQPGTYTAKIAVTTDSPYSVQPVLVTMTVNPPSSWGKITGTVRAASSGTPLAGATVQVCTMYDSRTGRCGAQRYTLKTDSSGHYQLWLNVGYNPLQLLAAKDGYQPQAKIATVSRGSTTTVSFSLRKA